MRQLLEDMEKNIAAELEIQMEIQEILDRQVEILTSGKTADLREVLSKADVKLQQSARLEENRSRLLHRIGLELGVPTHQVTLQMIEEALGDDAGALKEDHDALKSTIERIRETNKVVSLLLRHSVIFIEDLVSTITGAHADRSPLYTSSGRMQHEEERALSAER